MYSPLLSYLYSSQCIIQAVRHEWYALINTQDRQYTYCAEGPSCYHCCSGKAITIICSECVFVAIGIQHAMRMLHIDCHFWPA
jgi:hypothetical protein